MKFVSSRDFRIRPGEVWQFLELGEDVVITSHGKPFGVLFSTGDQNLQRLLNELLSLRARLAVSSMRERAQKTGLDKLSMNQVTALVDEARKSRRKKNESSHRH